MLREAARSLFCTLLLCLVVPAPLSAQEGESGVSPTRLSLPEGPGSLEGVGENASVEPNMGMMAYGVPIEVPAGYHGLAPSLRLSYSSASGQSSVGMGWSLSIPSIERMTDRGLPWYDADDRVAANGGAELVRVATEGRESTYRERFEGGFVRYTWVDQAETGRRGYWVAEYPDGRVGYFGATSAGELVDSATVLGPEGAFRYHLVEMWDTLGHVVRYTYRKDGATPLIDRIEWVFEDNVARYSVHFEYDDRDDHISNARPGCDVRLTKRLEDIEVRVRGQRLRSYTLEHEPYAASGGFTQLAAVRRYGLIGEEPFPIAFSFSYSRGVGPGCAFPDCPAPVIRTMGGTGVNMASGDADLIDIDGDALPDLLDSSNGSHVIYLNTMSVSGSQTFAEPYTSTSADGGAARLSSTAVQMLDVDGDGYADVIDDDNGLVFFNVGDGDWAPPESVNIELPDMADPDARFFDVDGDHAIDVFFSDGGTTWWVPNLGDGRFGEPIFPRRNLGVGFVRDGVQLADMNGDGLLDAVRLSQGEANYRLNLGRSEWSDWITMYGLPFLPSPLSSLVDINGDSLADVVVVEGTEIEIWLNRSGRGFDESFVVDTALGGSIPERTGEMSVRYADMNGSGSTDIVWIDGSGAVTFLEIYPERPHLLTRIENGIGAVQEITYGSSVSHMVRDGDWVYRLPHPMQTVETLDLWDQHTNVHTVQQYAYHDGYYDPFERRFSGFATVEVLALGDESVEAGEVRYEFDVGVDDPYFRGMPRRTEQLSAGRTLDVVENVYADCDVDEVSGSLQPEVRYICQEAMIRTVQEGLTDPSEWVTIEERYEYDGYGNRNLTARLGVTAIGGEGCAQCTRPIGVYGEPCGGQCLGDEAYDERVFIEPGDATGGRWMLRNVCERYTYGNTRSSERTEEHTYYDGERFVGLGSCELERGLLTRRSALVSHEPSESVDVQRYARGSHGEVVASMDARGYVRRFHYDVAGILPVAEVVVMDDPSHDAYTLRSSVQIHPITEQIIASSDWELVLDSQVDGGGHLTQYNYDEFSRIVAVAHPGDSLERPSEEYVYELSAPISRIVTRRRIDLGGGNDLSAVDCFDGLGRRIQRITRVEPGRYLTDGFTRPSIQGTPAAVFQPYSLSTDACAETTPESAHAEQYHYDAAGRTTAVLPDDAAIFGTRSRATFGYSPLAQLMFDPIDLDPSPGNASYNTPTVTHFDGLGRSTRVEWFLEDMSTANPVTLELAYNEHGFLTQTVDPLGRIKTQTFDLFGRVTSVDDPDAGSTNYEYDAAGNQVARTDGLGIRVESAYDEAGRLIQLVEAASGAVLVDYIFDLDDECPIICSNTLGREVGVRYPLGAFGVGAEWRSYDSRGRLVQTSRELGEFRFDTELAHDNADRLIRVVHPDGTVLEGSFDGIGGLVGVAQVEIGVVFDERGSVSEVVAGDNVRTTYAYDALMRLSERAHILGGVARVNVELTRDRLGNVTGVHDLLSAAGPTGGATYTYDALYRLVDAALDEVSVAESETVSYTYDPLGNITSIESNLGADSPRHLGALEYDGSNPGRLLTAGALAYGYDARGRVTQRGAESYTYDALGRLVTVQVGEERRASYLYGARAERVIVDDGATWIWHVSDEFELVNGVAVSQIRVNDSTIASLESTEMAAMVLGDLAPAASDGAPEGDGLFTVGDAWRAHIDEIQSGPGSEDEPDVDQLLLGAAMILVADADPGPTYFLRDPLGSVELRTSGDGVIQSGSSAYPYGGVRGSTASEPRAVEFAGVRHEGASDLMLFGVRWLDPVVGRFTAPDPLFETLGGDVTTLEAYGRYGYVLGNPINARDPTGLGKSSLVDDLFEAYSAIGDGIDIGNTASDLQKANCSGCALEGVEIAPPSWTDRIEVAWNRVGWDVVATVASGAASPAVSAIAGAYSIVDTAFDVVDLAAPRETFEGLGTSQLKRTLPNLRSELAEMREARDTAHRQAEITNTLIEIGPPTLDREQLTNELRRWQDLRDQAGSLAFQRSEQVEAIETELRARDVWFP